MDGTTGLFGLDCVARVARFARFASGQRSGQSSTVGASFERVD